MPSVRSHPAPLLHADAAGSGDHAHPHNPPHSGPHSGTGGRLNLLLSYAGWQPDPWVDRLPRLLEPMGVFSHLAQSGRQASDVIRTVRIHVAVVDLALPLDIALAAGGGLGAPAQTELDAPEFTEGGTRLLELLSRLDEPPPVVAVKRNRTTRDDVRDLSHALRLGAFAVVDRPHDAKDLDVILQVIRRIMERHYQGRWPS